MSPLICPSPTTQVICQPCKSCSAACIVRRLKYSGVGKLASFMGEDMVRAYRFLEPTGADCVTWVPMHKKRLRRRGYNHAELLARDVDGVLLNQMNGIRGRIRSTLANDLHNNELTLTLRLSKSEDVARVLSKKELFEAISKKNPAIEKLRGLLDLEFA